MWGSKINTRMNSCTCCNPPKHYSAPKALYKHQRKYDPNFVEPSRTPVRDAYEANPKKCQGCGGNISYSTFYSVKGKAKYCGRSCAAKVNNSARIRALKEKPLRIRVKKPSKPKGQTHYLITCQECGNDAYRGGPKQKYCSLECTRAAKWKEKKKDPNTKWTSVLRKKQLLEELGHQCQNCKNTEWMGRPITLEIEHIDGNHEDNSRENCTLLCPNCHSQTPTYKAKNKGNGRAFRRQRYAEGKSY